MFGLDLMIMLAIAVAAYMAWNIGANDVANAMGTSVGSGALTLRNAIIIAAVFEFCGAFFAGDAVTDTVRKGVLVISEEEMASLSSELQYGFIAAMLAAALWITVATRYGLPVSTTHSILGGIIGFGLFIDPSLVDFHKVGQIVLSWVISPLLGGVLAYGTFTVIRMTIMESDDPIQRSRWMAPILAFPTFFVLALALQFKALKYLLPAAWLPAKDCAVDASFMAAVAECLPLPSLQIALLLGAFASLVLYLLLRNYEFKESGYAGVEQIFVWLQIITACYVAFAHGANDRSNAIGPMAAVWQVYQAGVLSPEASVPLWLVLLGSAGIVIGIAGGAAGGLLHAVATVGFGVDHIISGVAINILAPALARFLSREVFAQRPGGGITQSPRVDSVGDVDVVFLSGGDLFGWTTPDLFGWVDDRGWFLVSDLCAVLSGITSDVSWATLLALALVPASVVILWRTSIGLRIRAAGEHPVAADSLGVNVYRMKYLAVVVSGGRESAEPSSSSSRPASTGRPRPRVGDS